MSDYLQCIVRNQRLLLPIENINMVVALPTLQVVPDQTPSFLGMLNFHGEPVPIYDLACLLTGNQTNCDLDTQVLLLALEKQQLGFVIDDVLDLVEIQAEKLKVPPQDVKPYVQALFETQELSAWLLNIERLIKEEALDRDHEVPHE